MTQERYRKLDETIKPLCKDFDDFESGEVIVRIGGWGYMAASEYESLFTTTRERHEYQALSNTETSEEADIFAALVMISNASDEELDEILDAQLDEAIIYYTEAE